MWVFLPELCQIKRLRVHPDRILLRILEVLLSTECKADRSDGFLLGVGPDREHARLTFVPEAEELRVAFHQLLTGFRTTEKRCHPVCVTAFQYRQIINSPRLQKNLIRYGSTLCAIANIGRFPHPAQRPANELPADRGTRVPMR